MNEHVREPEHPNDAAGDDNPDYVEGGGLGPNEPIMISEIDVPDPIVDRCARVVMVVETRMLERGGVRSNPSRQEAVRAVVEYWTLDGRRLAEADTNAGEIIQRLEEWIEGMYTQQDQQRRAVAKACEDLEKVRRERDAIKADLDWFKGYYPKSPTPGTVRKKAIKRKKPTKKATKKKAVKKKPTKARR